MARYTPWHVIGGSDGAMAIAGQYEYEPREFSRVLIARDVAIEHAPLLAAAPELLKQLKTVLACIELTGQCLGDMEGMRVAIAKAEGNQ